MTEKLTATHRNQAGQDSRSTAVHLLLHWEERQPNVVYMIQPLADGSVVEYTWKQVAAV